MRPGGHRIVKPTAYDARAPPRRTIAVLWRNLRARVATRIVHSRVLKGAARGGAAEAGPLPTNAIKPRYRPFGTFRLLLALLVLVQHALILLAPPAREVFYSLEMGAVAVTTFFALSGFIVAEAMGSFYAGRPGAFLANRVLRVAPPYLAALAIAVAIDSALFAGGRLLPLDAPLHGAPWHLRVVLAGVLEILPGVTVQRVSGQDFSFIPFAWTLRVEFAFYLVAAATVWLMTVRELAGWRHLVLGSSLAAAYAIFAAFAWHTRLHPGQIGALQIICVPFFAFGTALFFLARRPGLLSRLHLSLVSFGVVLAFTYWGQRGHPVLAYQLPMLCALFAILALLTTVKSVPPTLHRWDRRLGELSYPLYVSHGVVLTLLSSMTPGRGIALYVSAIPLSLLLAAAVHASVEQPLRAIRTRLRGATV